MAADESKSDDIDSPPPQQDEPTSVIRPNADRRSRAAAGLPTWTATEAVVETGSQASAPATEAKPRRPLRRAALVALAMVVVAGVGGLGGWLVGRNQSSSQIGSTEVSTDGDPSPAAAGRNGGDQAASGGTDDATGDPGATSTTPPPTEETPATATQTSLAPTTDPFVVPATPDNPSGAAQYAIMTGGKAIMRGWYPSDAQAEQAVEDATVIMGPGNVIDETEIEPRAVIDPDSFAVYFEDYILFERDSATITADFFELLNYPLFFMQQSPDATVTVVARTDATGSADYNLDLAARRAEAVRDYWLTNGGNADQIILDPRGEEGAEEGVDDEQARLDRRVELIVSGFLAAN